MDIKNINGTVLWSGDVPDLKTALIAAVAGKADLRGANLGGANLQRTDLWEANLGGANLREANLRGTDFWGANLQRADLRGAKYGVSQVLLAHWYTVTPEICAYLMRLDASALPDGERLMDEWAAGGPCPLSRSNGVDRVANFQQEKQHWGLAKTLPAITLWELWEKLAAEKNIQIR